MVDQTEENTISILTLKGFHYKGPFVSEDDNFITIFDIRSGKEKCFNKLALESITSEQLKTPEKGGF